MKTLASSTTETPISTSEPGGFKTARAFGIFDEATDLTRERFDAAKAMFDPAPGVDLTDAYADRMAVRVERDAITAAGSVPVPGDLPKPVEQAPMLDQPGRQTSPELAALAAVYLDYSEAKLIEDVTVLHDAKAVAAVVRRLAASVLSQVNG
jgi:hypothetical protein